MKSVVSLGLFGVLAGLSLGCGRQGAPTGGANPPAPAAAETADAALAALAGDWRVVSIQNLPPGFHAPALKTITARVKGKEIELSDGIGWLNRGEIRLDPTKSPKQFDIITLDRDGKPRTIKGFITSVDGGKEYERPVTPVLGLYRLDGDKLTIAVTDRDDYRPTELKPSVMENTGGFVTVNKRGSTAVIVVELTRGKAPEPTEPDESGPDGVARWFLTSFRGRNVDNVLKVSTAPFLIELDDPKNARVVEKSAI